MAGQALLGGTQSSNQVPAEPIGTSELLCDPLSFNKLSLRRIYYVPLWAEYVRGICLINQDQVRQGQRVKLLTYRLETGKQEGEGQFLVPKAPLWPSTLTLPSSLKRP